MDPLLKIRDAHKRGILDEKTFKLIKNRFDLAVSGIARIEKASGLYYPIAYVDPSAIIVRQDSKAYQYGIFFARTIPIVTDSEVQVVIQISAPLIAYGLKGTIHAILAHEFLHYLELLYRIGHMKVISDEITGNLFESAYADESRLFEPSAVFTDRMLLRHIVKRFPSGFRDYKLEDKTVKNWIDKGLPQTEITADSNTTRLSAESLSRMNIDAVLLEKLDKIEKTSEKIIRRKSY
ncbi:MAG: hypothetical protein K8823_821 [Cenarchaeum symbiont of Oopsacas minuta]|nr:hypothetical protein [Cenarchaeum symbiont of Oopsacas minuta]